MTAIGSGARPCAYAADTQRTNSRNREDEYDRETGDDDEQLDAKPERR